MGLADLHIHSLHSWDGTCSVSAVLKRAAHHARLNVIALTDHDNMEGIPEALDLAPSYGIEVIPGCEISTADGHLLGLFIQKPVPAGLSLLESLLLIGDQGGIAVAAHPMTACCSSLTTKAITAAVNHPDASQILVGIESFNAGLVFRQSNKVALELARRLNRAEVGSSDAHLPFMIGMGVTVFNGRTSLDLRHSLEAHTTRALLAGMASVPQIVTTWIAGYLMRKAGWVHWNKAADTQLQLVRLNRISFSGRHI